MTPSPFSLRRFPLRALTGALLVSATLSACAPLIVGGAMVGGAFMVTHRRTSGAQVEDQAIELKAMNRTREILGDLFTSQGVGDIADKAAKRKPRMHLLPYGIPLCLGFVSYLIYLHGA